MTVSDTVVIAAPATDLYARVSDPRQTGQWSPENLGATLAGPVEVGTVFVGHNKRGWARWSTECVVTAAEPGRRFAFTVRKWGPRKPLLSLAIASWEYRLTEVDGRTEVTETWVDDRRKMPDRVANAMDFVLVRKPFSTFQRTNIARSLAALKTLSET